MNRKIPLKYHHVTLLLSASLCACTPRPAMVPVDSAGIDLAPVTLAEAEPAVRESCERSIQQALLRHGFRVDPGATRVEVEVAFWQDADGDALPGGDPLDSSLVGAGAIGAPMSRRIRSTADLTAIVHFGSSNQKVLTSGSADQTQQVPNATPTGGGSRISACAIAADRFADALVEVINNASR